MNLKLRTLGLVALGVLAAAPLHAGEVYSWVDDKGVTHYSDTRPAGTAPDEGGVETIAVLDEFSEADPSGDYYSIVNQWQRIQEERAEERRHALERERLRTERIRAESEARQAQAAAAARVAQPESRTVFVNSSYPYLGRRNAGFIRPGIHSRFNRGLSEHRSRPRHNRPQQRSHQPRTVHHVGNN